MSLRRLLVSQMSLRRLLVSQMSLRGALLTQDLVCRELVDAAVSCGSQLSSQRPPAEFTCTLDDAEPILRGTLDNAEPILRSTLDDAEPILRSTLDDAEPILRGLLLTQTHPAKHLFTLAGLMAAREHNLTSLGSWQRQPRPRRRSSPQAREGHRDTAECEDRSPDFFGLGIWTLLYLLGYVSAKEPVAQKVARITVLPLASTSGNCFRQAVRTMDFYLLVVS
ncbi:unnamed protein product, partial [Penicillium nalgiovense]